MKTNFFKKALFILGAALFFTACSNDDDNAISEPSIQLIEVGSNNNFQAFAGADLHLEAEIEAAANIDKIEVEIHSETTGEWEFNQIFTEGYAGAKNATFHEHIDIPADVAPGDYHLHIKVTDKNGNSKNAESELAIVLKNPVAALVFQPVTSTEVEGHGDHFHGIGAEVLGTAITVSFDENGNAISGGHLHLNPTAIYKIALKTYDNKGAETQNKFIADATTATNYKAFLVGGSFVLNAATANGTGAIFQPREATYADGTTGSTTATTSTGVTSYLTIGADNKGEKDVTFVMRKVNAGVKTTITRADWNRNDYATAFAGSNELELKFEIHAE